MKSFCFSRQLAAIFVVSSFAIAPICRAADVAAGAKPSADASSGLYLKVKLDGALKLSKLKPGDKVEGTLARDVYSDDLELFPAGDRMQLTVDHLEKRRRIPNDHWPWVVKVFTPRHESYPVFKTALVFPANEAAKAVAGEEASKGSLLQVSLISVSRMREVRAQRKNQGSQRQVQAENTPEVAKQPAAKEKPGKSGKQPLILTMILEGSAAGVPAAAGREAWASDETLPAGTACRILLLSSVSASKSKPGDSVKARLIEPVQLNSRVVLPAGSLFDGIVVKKTPPKWGSRAGSLSLSFTGLTLPDGDHVPVAASLAGAELDQRSHTRIDAEGQLHGEHPGKAWMAINIGVTAGIAKEVDDGTQLIVEAIISTATDVSTAGGARIAASCISGIFIVSRHGRDVILPRFTEMDISLDRPLSLNKATASATAATAPHGD